MQKFQIDANNAANIQAYIDYNNIVGNDDGGTMFTPEQYEEYKSNLKKQLNIEFIHHGGMKKELIAK